MATRRPLVVVSGAVQELPAGDDLPGGPWKTVTVSSAQQDIDFTGLDLDADVQYRIVLIHAANATDSQGIGLMYNGDTTAANYQHQYVQGSNTTVSAGRFSNAAIGLGGTPSGTNRTTQTNIVITKLSGKYPSAASTAVGVVGSDILHKGIAHQWLSTANVTSIKLRHDNLFGVGTVARLYKA